MVIKPIRAASRNCKVVSMVGGREFRPVHKTEYDRIPENYKGYWSPKGLYIETRECFGNAWVSELNIAYLLHGFDLAQGPFCLVMYNLWERK